MPEPSTDIKAQIEAYAKAHLPREACGFVVAQSHGKCAVLDCANVHPTPDTDFKISGDDWEKAEELGEVVAVWHSEPNGRGKLSPADLTWSEEVATPYLMYAVEADKWDYHEPNGWMHDLTGRPFVYGILDCYSTARDFYNAKHGILLPNYQREHGWWKHSDLITKTYGDAGFVRVDDELRPSDGILMSTMPKYRVVNHIGIYVGEGYMLHHPSNRASTLRPYHPTNKGDFYVASTVAIVRHQSLLK